MRIAEYKNEESKNLAKRIKEMKEVAYTGKEISEELGIPLSRVYYYFNRENRLNNPKVRERSRENNKEQRKQAKELMTKLRAEHGGECSICGFNLIQEALQFHHKNPEEKEGQISRLVRLNPAKAKQEVKKCVLVCANCHIGIHKKEFLNRTEAEHSGTNKTK